MLRAIKANRVIRISDDMANDYRALGYKIQTMDRKPYEEVEPTKVAQPTKKAEKPVEKKAEAKAEAPVQPVEETVTDEAPAEDTTEAKALADMSFEELKVKAAELGLDTKTLKSKKALAEAIEQAEAE